MAVEGGREALRSGEGTHFRRVDARSQTSARSGRIPADSNAIVLPKLCGIGGGGHSRDSPSIVAVSLFFI